MLSRKRRKKGGAIRRSLRPGNGRAPIPLAPVCVALIVALIGFGAVGSNAVRAASAVAWGEEGFGYAYNVKEVEEAERLAKEACAENGCKTDVRILASSSGQGYAAIAVDGNIIGIALGMPNLASAMQRARAECLRQGGRFPRITVTFYDRGH